MDTSKPATTPYANDMASSDGRRGVAVTPGDVAASEDKGSGITSRPWWPWLKHGVTFGFFGLVGWLLYRQAGTIEWGEVMQSLRALPRSVLLTAAGLSAATYAVYSTFDLIGRYCVRHKLSTRSVLGVSLISYAFNLNLGTLVGGVAFRYRLYTRLGLENAETVKITLLSMLTNWIGYCLLAGVVFWVWPFTLPPQWKLDSAGLHWMGAALVVVAALYVGAAAWRRGRDLVIRGQHIPLPGWPVALVQLSVSSAHWALMGGILYVMFQGRIEYTAVLGTLLVAAVAGVIAHVPAGLGVLEAVFVALLSHKLPSGQILAALLGYRAVYYLAPLLLATVAYFIAEVRVRRNAVEPPVGDDHSQ